MIQGKFNQLSSPTKVEKKLVYGFFDDEAQRYADATTRIITNADESDKETIDNLRRKIEIGYCEVVSTKLYQI